MINSPEQTYNAVSNKIFVEDIKNEQNRKIVSKLYEEYKSGNSNINSILDNLDQEDVSYITGIMAENLEITDINKGISDILLTYAKDQLITEKEQIIKKIDSQSLSLEEGKVLESRLSQIIIDLARLKRG